MKKYIFSLVISLTTLTTVAQLEFSAYYYYNPYLNSSILPSYYPTIVGNNRINIVTPLSFNLSDVKFPGLTIAPINITSPNLMNLSSYESYSLVTNIDPDLVSANHNYIVGKIENDILTGRISNGCSGIARITTSAAKKWLIGFCPIAETPPTAVACGIGVALQNAIVLKTSQELVKKGCKITVKYISDDLIEISVETYRVLDRSIEEAKFWMGFINSIDGMIWIMNRVQSG